MDKQQAQQIIRETFETPFDKSRFTNFVRNLLNHMEDAPFTYQGIYIPEKFRQHIKSLERIGKFSDGENSLDILIITLKKETSLERARTMQRNFIAWYLNGSRGGEMKDAALVAYVSPGQDDWRFSLVKMDYKFEKTKTGKVKVKEEFTPARRWSFLVGANEKSHTAQSRLVNILANDEQPPTLAELENAFDIETVTKEFFSKYRELFLRTKEALDEVVKNDPKIKADFEAKGVDTVNFAKKLLGQIVFLYFLQKKGWFGVGRDDDWGSGSKRFLRELFDKKHGDYNNFFNDILEPLFYEALRIDRSHDDDYYSRFNCKIPFLNGGLFDPIGNYDWVHTDINLPNDLFSNSRKTKEGDIGDGILDVFDRYNFTVCEDEPLEKEVAIDPELLGKAYEKFNAIRPDNYEEYKAALKSGKKGAENKFNKKFGVYYTPREIVHYMCKQSLINYLYTRVEEAGLADAIKKQDIKDLIEVGELITEHEATALIKEEKIKNGIQKSTEYTALLSDSIRENAAAIDKWLADITVCDPAVGSGAFPVGMMNEIVRARNVLSVFLNDRKRNDYEFKRRCIEHSLYGVDIDPGAVEITKLRLWLSLVVDEEDIKNIKPLPNLDYRIMQGNSLISEFMGINFDTEPQKENLLPKDETDVLIEEFQQKKNKFMNESNVAQKVRLKEEVENLLIEIFETKLKSQKAEYFNRLKDIENKYSILPNKAQREELIKQEKEKLYKESGFDLESAEKQLKEFTSGRQIKPFFLWNLYFSEVFHQKGGFDVVIGNPPYQGFREMGKTLKSSLQKRFVSAQGKFDLYIPFIEQGFRILRENGFFVYICPTAFTKREHGKQIRAFLFSSICLNELVDFEHSQIFEGATNYTGILSFIKTVSKQKNIFAYRKGLSGDTLFCSQKKLSKESWIFVDEISDSILNRLNENVRLDEIAHISEGVVTGLNKLYLKSANQIEEENFEKNYFYPTLRGKEIDKYYYFNNSEWLFYPYLLKNGKTIPIDEGNLKQQCPTYYAYLKKHLNLITNRKYFVSSNKKWFELWNQRNLENFLDEKIVTPELSEYNRFMLVPEKMFYGDTVCGIRIKEQYKDKINIKFLLSLLNSQLIEWYYKKTTVPKAGGFFIYKVMFLKSIPIKISSYAAQKAFITLVDKILAITKDADYLQNPAKQAKVKEYERQIDRLVYDLYGLTEEEIKIVEGSTK